MDGGGRRGRPSAASSRGSGETVMDPYKILEIESGAGRAEIERAVETRKRRFHPELNPGDDEARRRYREVLAAHAALTGVPAPALATEEPGRDTTRNRQETYLTVALTFREAALGTTKRVSFPIDRSCKPCRGRGCADCGQTGSIREEVKKSVRIPPGAVPGGELRYPHGDSALELVLIPRVADDPFFERLGDNIYCKVERDGSRGRAGNAVLHSHDRWGDLCQDPARDAVWDQAQVEWKRCSFAPRGGKRRLVCGDSGRDAVHSRHACKGRLSAAGRGPRGGGRAAG